MYTPNWSGTDLSSLFNQMKASMPADAPSSLEDDELKNLERTGLGSQNFQLMNPYPAPDPHKGHKVEVKGFLIRDPKGDRINVTSVQGLAPACGN